MPLRRRSEIEDFGTLYFFDAVIAQLESLGRAVSTKKVCAQCEGTEWGLLGGWVVCCRCPTYACGYCKVGEPQNPTCVEAMKAKAMCE